MPLRPNQIFALALDDQLVTDVQAKQILQLLRSDFSRRSGCGRWRRKILLFASYEGGVAERDAAYPKEPCGRSCLAPS